MHWESLLDKEGKRKHYDKSCHRKQRGKYQKVGKKQSRIKQESFSKEGTVASYGAQKSSQRKAGKFSKERTVSLGVRKSKKGVITQKKQLLT